MHRSFFQPNPVCWSCGPIRFQTTSGKASEAFCKFFTTAVLTTLLYQKIRPFYAACFALNSLARTHIFRISEQSRRYRGLDAPYREIGSPKHVMLRL